MLEIYFINIENIMSKIIGIDLGTTFSAIAQLDDLGNPEVLSSTDSNKKITASAVYVKNNNVVVGDNVVIGTNSLVNKSLPDGCLAAGIPCKVIKENMYPKSLDDGEIESMVNEILSDWEALCEHKGITRTIKTKYEKGKIYLNQSHFETMYNIEDKTIEGHTNDVSEDLRDYLRRRGVKIYADRFFKSI